MSKAQKLSKRCRGKLCKQANSLIITSHQWPLSESTTKETLKNSSKCTIERERRGKDAGFEAFCRQQEKADIQTVKQN